MGLTCPIGKHLPGNTCCIVSVEFVPIHPLTSALDSCAAICTQSMRHRRRIAYSPMLSPLPTVRRSGHTECGQEKAGLTAAAATM
jgi:hypothetical protein